MSEFRSNKEGISVIVKSSPRGGLMEDLDKQVNLFEKEIHMFSKLLPAMYKVLDEPVASMSSDCYYVHVNGAHSLLVLEDLKPLEYVMHERQNGIDLDHCLMVMEKIARFHAASVVLYNKESAKIPKIFDEGLYCNVDMIKDWVMLSFRSCSKAAMKWPGIYYFILFF